VIGLIFLRSSVCVRRSSSVVDIAGLGHRVRKHSKKIAEHIDSGETGKSTSEAANLSSGESRSDLPHHVVAFALRPAAMASYLIHFVFMCLRAEV
jgi:hypothetical protein